MLAYINSRQRVRHFKTEQKVKGLRLASGHDLSQIFLKPRCRIDSLLINCASDQVSLGRQAQSPENLQNERIYDLRGGNILCIGMECF